MLARYMLSTAGESGAATGHRGLTEAVGGAGAQSPSSAKVRGWPWLSLRTVDTESPQEEQGIHEGLGAWLHGGGGQAHSSTPGITGRPQGAPLRAARRCRWSRQEGTL